MFLLAFLFAAVAGFVGWPFARLLFTSDFKRGNKFALVYGFLFFGSPLWAGGLGVLFYGTPGTFGLLVGYIFGAALTHLVIGSDLRR